MRLIKGIWNYGFVLGILFAPIVGYVISEDVRQTDYIIPRLIFFYGLAIGPIVLGAVINRK